MTTIEAIVLLIGSVVIPYVVELIKSNTISGNKARWIAIGLSIISGVLAGSLGGIPATPEAWVGCLIMAIGGTQSCYTIFRSVGITSKLLDALMNVGSDTPEAKHAAAGNGESHED